MESIEIKGGGTERGWGCSGERRRIWIGNADRVRIGMQGGRDVQYSTGIYSTNIWKS